MAFESYHSSQSVARSRRIPNPPWVTQQARNFLLHAGEVEITHPLRDRDTKYTASFDAVRESQGVKIRKIPPKQPVCNSRTERAIQTLKFEVLRHFIAFGERHLNYLVQEAVRYYNDQRAHSRRDYLPPAAADPPPRNESADADEIVWQERLGGVIAWYERRAA